MLPLQGTCMPSLIRDLNSHMPHSVAEESKKKKRKMDFIFREAPGSPQNGSGRCRGSPCTRCSPHAQPSPRAASPPEGTSVMTDHPEPTASRGFTPGHTFHASGQTVTRAHNCSTIQQSFTALPHLPHRSSDSHHPLTSPWLCHSHDATQGFSHSTQQTAHSTSAFPDCLLSLGHELLGLPLAFHGFIAHFSLA